MVTHSDGTAVLFSGGLDSAVLAADLARRGAVHPVYVSVGLAWEPAELATAERLLGHSAYGGHVLPLQPLEFPMRDVYPPTHWALRGEPPAYDTPDEDVYLAGRNIVLLSKAGTWCGQKGIASIALGPLAGNPFPDARAAFFEAMALALSLGLDTTIAIETPFRDWHKEDVIRRGVELGVPFELTLSCMNPQPAAAPGAPPFRHCGACSKCRERKDAFRRVGVADPAVYATGQRGGTTVI